MKPRKVINNRNYLTYKIAFYKYLFKGIYKYCNMTHVWITKLASIKNSYHGKAFLLLLLLHMWYAFSSHYFFLVLINAIQIKTNIPCGSVVKNPAANEEAAGDTGSIPGSGRSPGAGSATHSSILGRIILWIEEPGGL